MTPPPLSPNPATPASFEKTAAASFALALLGFLCCGIASLLAVVFGHLARKRLSASGRKGATLASLGLIIGYLQLAVFTAGIVVLFVPALQLSILYTLKTTFGNEDAPSKANPDIASAPFVLILPKDHPPSKPIPCIFWLHGYGSTGKDIFHTQEEAFQTLANRHQIAFVGITAGRVITEGEDAGGYQWEESAREDQKHLDAVLKLHAGEVTPDKGKAMLFGFSQGGKVAGLLAAAQADQYRGALLFSPGGLKNNIHLVPTGARLAEEKFFCFTMNESPITKLLTRHYASSLKAAGARVSEIYYPDVHAHTFPPDFNERFESWIIEILSPVP